MLGLPGAAPDAFLLGATRALLGNDRCSTFENPRCSTCGSQVLESQVLEIHKTSGAPGPEASVAGAGCSCRLLEGVSIGPGGGAGGHGGLGRKSRWRRDLGSRPGSWSSVNTGRWRCVGSPGQVTHWCRWQGVSQVTHWCRWGLQVVVIHLSPRQRRVGAFSALPRSPTIHLHILKDHIFFLFSS